MQIQPNYTLPVARKFSLFFEIPQTTNREKTIKIKVPDGTKTIEMKFMVQED